MEDTIAEEADIEAEQSGAEGKEADDMETEVCCLLHKCRAVGLFTHLSTDFSAAQSTKSENGHLGRSS